MVLFWAHHEKLCVIDERIAFMGGLDMCKSGTTRGPYALADRMQALEDGTPQVSALESRPFHDY